MLAPQYEMMLEEFEEKRPVFLTIEKVAKDTLFELVKNLGMLVNSVESRIKEVNSLRGKLELKGYKYNFLQDITDLVGARVVTFYSFEIDKIAAEVEKKFEIDWENSVDKRKIYKVDQFGYMSLHYICRIPKELYYDEKMPEVNEFRFEIQLRTVLQHTWASIYHDTGYKNDIEVPTEYLRNLNRIAGLLELVDAEFSNIKLSLDEYRRKVKKIIKSGTFEDVELNKDSFLAYIEAGGFDRLNNKIASINNMEIEQTNLLPFLAVFKLFDYKTLGDIENVQKENFDLTYQYCVRQFSGTDIDIMTDATGILSLCIVSGMKLGFGEGGILLLLNTLYGKRKVNERTAQRILEHCKSMGLIK